MKLYRNLIRHINLSSNRFNDSISKEQLVNKVKELINNNKVIIFSKTYCPYCIKAKEILNKYKLNDYKIIELDKIENGNEYQIILEELTNSKTVPRIFINGICIGGYDDTFKLHSNKQLKAFFNNKS